jgi:transcriptional regulator with XRE-family HTH domain
VRLSALRLAVVLSEQERKARIAYLIETARERRGLTPPQLGERVGRSRGTVNDWEANRSTPSLVDLGPLCAALGIEPRAFAELPAIPADPLAEYLIAAAESGVVEGIRRARRRRASPVPKPRARSRARPTPGNGAGPE